MSNDVHTLSGAYALDALSVAEEAEFESHLADCDSCRAETDEFREIAADLAALEAREVPARLRESVMRAADQQRQLPPLVSESAPVPLRTITPRWRRGLVAAAAAVALIGGAGVVTSSMDQPSLDAASSQVFSASDAHTLVVPVPGDGSLVVASSRTSGRVAVDGREMPELSAESVYQLWLLRDGAATSMGLLDEDGTVLDLPEAGVDLAVTVEPAGGSEQPTTVPVAQVDPTES